MLNVGIPELDGPNQAGTDANSNPEEQNAETGPQDGLETGENANLDSDLDPVSVSAVEVFPLEAEVETAPADVDSELVSLAEAPVEATVEAAVELHAEPQVEPSADAGANPAIEAKAHAAEPQESFGDMLYEFERTHSHKADEGTRQIDATVVTVTAESVFLDIGFKTEGVLPLSAFATAKEPPKLGDKLRVTIKTRNEEGYYEVSLLKIAQPKDWSSLEAAFAEKAVVAGTVTAAIKGGLSVDVGVRAFMPASRSGARDPGEMEKLIGQEIRCRIIKLDVADEDVVVDRRIVLEEEERSTKERRYSEVNEGDLVSGTVRSLTDYGAFVDIGGVDALLHISDMAWTRIAAPSDVLSAGQQIEAKVLKIESGKRRISIGVKQLQPHPWDSVGGKFLTGERVHGVVTRLTDFGAFVELAPGIEGLIHISEMSWAKKVRKPGDMVKIGDTVEVVILSVNQAEKRISLGLKQALGDPWVAAAERLSVGAVVEGAVVSFTKFGAFIQVAEGVEGMVHISEIVADKRINHPQDELKLGQTVKAQVLEVDKEKRQLKLSIKQLIPTGLEEYIAEHQVGDVVSGRVLEAGRGETSAGASGKSSGDRMMVELGEGIRISCKLPAETPAAREPEKVPETGGKLDLSGLSSLLKAKWKSGPTVDAPLSRKSEGIRPGQVRSFRIVSLDATEKKIEIQAV